MKPIITSEIYDKCTHIRTKRSFQRTCTNKIIYDKCIRMVVCARKTIRGNEVDDRL